MCQKKVRHIKIDNETGGLVNQTVEAVEKLQKHAE